MCFTKKLLLIKTAKEKLKYAKAVVETVEVGEDYEHNVTISYAPFDSLIPEIGIVKSFVFNSMYGNEHLSFSCSTGLTEVWFTDKNLFLYCKYANLQENVYWFNPEGSWPLSDYDTTALDYYPVEDKYKAIFRKCTTKLHNVRNGWYYLMLNDREITRYLQPGDTTEFLFFTEKPEWGMYEDTD